MFLTRVSPIPYSDPWATPFDQRRAALLQGSPRVAYYYDRPDNSTFRYRAYNMIQVLRESGRGVGAAFFHLQEIEFLSNLIDQLDVLVICRARYSEGLNRLISRARSKGKRVLFDIDDLVFDCAFVPLVVNTLDQDLGDANVWDAFFANAARLGATLRLCDAAISTNEFLATRLREWSGKPVAVIPNFLNREQMDISSRIYQEKRARRFARDRKVTVGYFSGTPTHNKDLQIAAEALAHIMRRDRRLTLRIVGFMDLKGHLRGLEQRIELHPLQDFINLQRLVGEVEINIVPLQDNTFTNCKSELKYFEAGIAGTLSIASPTHTYQSAIRDGENGFLAKAYEWEAKFQSVLDRLGDYPTMAERAYADCEQRYGWKHQLGVIDRAVFG